MIFNYLFSYESGLFVTSVWWWVTMDNIGAIGAVISLIGTLIMKIREHNIDTKLKDAELENLKLENDKLKREAEQKTKEQ